MLHTAITTDWTADRRVQRILRSFTAHPPRRVFVAPDHRWTTHTSAYAGYRVECLLQLWNEIAAPILAACDASGDYQPWTDFCCQSTVDQAIDRAALATDLDVIREDVLARAVAAFEQGLAA